MRCHHFEQFLTVTSGIAVKHVHRINPATVRSLKLGHPDNEYQSDGSTKTIDFNIFKFSQSNVRNKTMKSQLAPFDAYATTMALIDKLHVKLSVLMRA